MSLIFGGLDKNDYCKLQELAASFVKKTEGDNYH